ncbi:hypothetical protein INS49_004880 [Diaporthe citri]|uniref:uncharacterized protein n=1 Tax=Diaporthe citri TaxID=83186 RepID=UPI001C7E5243|nr:uncharacterized protein INS49_004880 [Diaporthe citri]KAG6354275.1 hypothetical protein INS49_004880 [Diaporthe citri]
MNVPLTIEDAITVTKALDFQYLWVDQYCIDQGDPKDKHGQIQQMDRTYKCAALTIIAAAGDGCNYGLPGVSACRRDVLDLFVVDDVFTFGIHPQEDRQYWKRGRWHTRGWTFQEALLSRRRLVFSDTAMYYECMGYTDGAWQSELFGGVDRARADGAGVQSVVGSNTLSNLVDLGEDNFEPVSHKGLLESFLTYISLVTQYTTRSLSHDSDALDAFRGAANALQHFDHPVYSISGIPFVVPDQAGAEDSLVENSFLCGLAWQSTAGGVAPNPGFPSWSWANPSVWNVTWIRDDQEHEPILTEAIYHAHGVHIEFDLNGSKELHAFAEFAKACRNPTPLARFDGTPTALCFKSRILFSRFTSEYLDYSYESFIGDAYTEIGYGTLLAAHDTFMILNRAA